MTQNQALEQVRYWERALKNAQHSYENCCEGNKLTYYKTVVFCERVLEKSRIQYVNFIGKK